MAHKKIRTLYKVRISHMYNKNGISSYKHCVDENPQEPFTPGGN
jgi:hypothetical protein